MREKIIFWTILLAISVSFLASHAVFEQTNQIVDENICRNITFGLLPFEDNCNYFIICQSQVPRIERCPANSIFDARVSACVLGDPNTCEIFTTTTEYIPTTTTTEYIPTTTEYISSTTTEFPTECPLIDDPLNPVFLPDNYNCNNYFLCFNGTKIERSCSEGLMWDIINERCDFPHRVECESRASTVISTTTQRNFVCSEWLQCPISGFGYLPHMTNCMRYFYCDRGIRHLRTCPYGEIFDVVTLRCNNPYDSSCARYTQCL